ncbi:hypothetical protein [Amylibacter sp. IMCC11727]|uniref:hypothetical protein n=1 Tax=Amylibacter sp. IMCC11727 TaxID=3039851 RepID=UPI00244E5270|nr:hypothetical protein [Amylibacter sp. IMCC11727]WGI22457.1 hypothetical protein QBD29_03295 [Amylibacter sp. IMCC11727]
MIAKALYLICVQFLLVAIAIALAAAAALVMPAGVMQQAVVILPLFFLATSSALTQILRVLVIPVSDQGRSFTRIAFWGTLGLMIVITGILIGVAYFALVSLTEATVIWVVLFLVGQMGLMRWLPTPDKNFEVFD